jgi:hypothetical protein
LGGIEERHMLIRQPFSMNRKRSAVAKSITLARVLSNSM